MSTKVIDRLDWVGHKIARPKPPGATSPDSNRIREEESTWNIVSGDSEDITREFHLSEVRERIISLFTQHLLQCNIPQITICIEEMLTNILRYGFTNLGDTESPATEDDRRMFENVDPQIFTISVTLQRITDETTHSIHVCIEAGDQGPDLPKTPDEIIDDSIQSLFYELPAHGRGFTCINRLCDFVTSQHRINPGKKIMRFEKNFPLPQEVA